MVAEPAELLSAPTLQEPLRVTDSQELLTSPEEAFRPIHYLGSKWRLLDFIEEAVSDVASSGGTILDPFSGTGVVAARLARHHRVVASDIQEYARVLAATLLGPTVLPIRHVRDVTSPDVHRNRAAQQAFEALRAFEDAALEAASAGDANPLCTILEHGSVEAGRIQVGGRAGPLGRLISEAQVNLPRDASTVMTRYYGGVYFSYEQAWQLDELATAIRQLPRQLRDLPLAALLSTASEVVSSVGNQFAQPIRPRDRNGDTKRNLLQIISRRRALSPLRVFARWLERYQALQMPDHGGEAMRADYREALAAIPSDTAVIYADPPYTRDHYSRYYHVLETLARGDEPDLSAMRAAGRTHISRGLYRQDRHQSPFSIKRQAPEAFRELFRPAAELGVPLILSYSPYETGTGARPRLMTVHALQALAREYFGSIETRFAHHIAHSKFNANRLNTDVTYGAEVLLICKP